MPIQSASLGDTDVLVVSPDKAKRILDIGLTKLYDLINNGELQAYKAGKSRRITVASIRQYVERRISESAGK